MMASREDNDGGGGSHAGAKEAVVVAAAAVNDGFIISAPVLRQSEPRQPHLAYTGDNAYLT